jgi:ABC-type branched-subunit amino acid transport system ATPase component
VLDGRDIAGALNPADSVQDLDHGQIVFSGPVEELAADRSILERHLGVSV